MKNLKLKTKNYGAKNFLKKFFAIFQNFSIFIFHFEFKQGGYAAITTMLLTLIVSIIVLSGFNFFTLQEVKISRQSTQSIKTNYAAEGGIEDSLYRFLTGKQLAPEEILTVDSGTTTIKYSISGSQRIFRAEGRRESLNRNFETRADITTTGVGFLYGAQIGDGGLVMGQGARIAGNVYSGGDITGASGATITGDAFVSVGDPPAINQSWETQNSDLAVGQASGVIISIVDSAGDTGEFTSLALGADDLARISYIDEPNTDLKFALCDNDVCSSSSRLVVDSVGADEVTSLGLGSDGFGRISYYDDLNDDLEYAECANNDCSSRVLTTIDSAGNMGDFSSIDIGSDSFVRIGYWNDSAEDVKFVRCANATCSSKIVTAVDTAGDIGQYISMKLGSDDFGRMSYSDDDNDDLKFARCANLDCTSKNITTVDSAGRVGQYTSLTLDANNFAFISYYDDTNDDLKFARCANLDCTSKSIITVDSAGDVGKYSSIAIGPDGFARISYYDATNGDLKFARCANLDCTSKSITTVDSTGVVGQYASLGLGSDGLGRISYYDSTNGDLKFARCFDENCSSGNSQIDIAQSFQPSLTDKSPKVEFYLKKVGNPPNAALRLVKDSGGSPSVNPNDVLATGTIDASLITGSYGWVNVSFASPPIINANILYWLVIDANPDGVNYMVWGLDSAGGYANGSVKKSADWSLGNWTTVSGDLNFKVYMGGTDRQIKSVAVNGNANAHIIDSSTVGGNANTYNLIGGSVAGNVSADSISNCSITGNAAYNTRVNCTVGGSVTTPNTPPADPPKIPLPISDATVNSWKTEASAGGTCVPPECDASGNYAPTICNVSLGPKKIIGNLILSASCSGGQLLTVTGTIWVAGNIEIDNNAKVKVASSYGDTSGIMLSDGTIHLSNNGTFGGSGASGSYIMFLTTVLNGGHHDSAIDLHNNAAGAIFYASRGMIYLHNNVNVTALVGYKIQLENNAVLTYDIGLENAKFSSGPGGGVDIKYWKEVE